MKKITAALCALLLSACSSSNQGNGTCQINGTLGSDKWDGQYIFLVPINKGDSVGVDSTIVHGHEFHFTATKSIVADIRLSWRTRFGTQNLLVVTEPGTVTVTIDSVSSGGGTPQNDSLQSWKRRTEEYKHTATALGRAYQNFYAAGDSVSGDALRAEASAKYQSYRNASLNMAKQMEGTALADFLNRMFPSND